MKHCPICNRSSEEARFYGEFCEFCSGKKLKEKLPANAEVIQCRDCGRINVAGSFVPETKGGMELLLAILAVSVTVAVRYKKLFLVVPIVFTTLA